MNDMPSNPMSALRLMPSKASEVARFSKGIIEAVKSGDANPLEVLVMLRSLEAVSELVREEIEENVNAEADRFNEKVIERYGARIEKREVGVKYNYARSGDIEYERLKVDAETAKSRLSEREAFLKALKEPITLVNKETGEVYEVNPPLKTSKSGVAVYLK
jgi:transcriptional/translational regulatory protein YebC/TACO1